MIEIKKPSMWMADVIEFFKANGFSVLTFNLEMVVQENDQTVLNCGLVETEWVKNEMAPLLEKNDFWWRKLESEVVTYLPK